MQVKEKTLFYRISTAALIVAGLCSLTQIAAAQAIGSFYSPDYSIHLNTTVPGLPTEYGGLTMKREDPNTLLITGNSFTGSAKIYSIQVTRDASNHISGFVGNAAIFANAPNLHGGLTYGPDDILFYTTYSSNTVGQIKPCSLNPDKIIGLTALGVASSVGALEFVPTGFPGAGRLKIVSYNNSGWYDTTVSPDGTGTYNIAAAVGPITVGGGPEGIAFVGNTQPKFTEYSVLIGQWSQDRISSFTLNANGDPVVSSRRDFVTGLGSGQRGMTIDPVTGDLLFTNGLRFFVVKGFTPPTTVPGVSISGKVTTEDCGTVETPLIVEFRTLSNCPLFTRAATSDANGDFIVTDVPRRNYRIAVRGSRWLSTALNADASTGDVTGLVFAPMPGGDADNNNAVDVFDLDILIQSFNLCMGDEGFDPRSDFNCDDCTDVFDLDVLIRNFNRDGE
jgi:hypothetical protein